MECRTCGQEFDPGDLGAVFFHEHKGIGDLPGLKDVPRGERIDDGPNEGYRAGQEAEQDDFDDPSWGAAYGDYGP